MCSYIMSFWGTVDSLLKCKKSLVLCVFYLSVGENGCETRFLLLSEFAGKHQERHCHGANPRRSQSHSWTTGVY